MAGSSTASSGVRTDRVLLFLRLRSIPVAKTGASSPPGHRALCAACQFRVSLSCTKHFWIWRLHSWTLS